MVIKIIRSVRNRRTKFNGKEKEGSQEEDDQEEVFFEEEARIVSLPPKYKSTPRGVLLL
jgi:hypothetical protein